MEHHSNKLAKRTRYDYKIAQHNSLNTKLVKPAGDVTYKLLKSLTSFFEIWFDEAKPTWKKKKKR